jgi:hypothetical protein
LPGTQNVREQLLRLGDRTNIPTWHHEHTQLPDILSFAAIGDRYNPAGQRLMFLENLQSDVFQKLRPAREQMARWRKFAAENPESHVAQALQRLGTGNRQGVTNQMDMYHLLDQQLGDLPFQQNWQDLSLKALMQEAARKPAVPFDQPYSAFAWTPAKTQKRRWPTGALSGFKMLYDEKIPGVLNKLSRLAGGGAKVRPMDVGGGRIAPGIDITDDMRQYLQSEALPLWQMAGLGGVGLGAGALAALGLGSSGNRNY